MAIPPDPIEDVLPHAALIVDAEVRSVVSTGAQLPKVNAPPGWSGSGQKAPAQVVILTVHRVVSGETTARELTVEKPVADYALRPGSRGPYLLDDSQPRRMILGRYGPDSYSLERIERALRR